MASWWFSHVRATQQSIAECRQALLEFETLARRIRCVCMSRVIMKAPCVFPHLVHIYIQLRELQLSLSGARLLSLTNYLTVLEFAVVFLRLVSRLIYETDFICHYGIVGRRSNCCAGRQVAAAGWFGGVATVDIC